MKSNSFIHYVGSRRKFRIQSIIMECVRTSNFNKARRLVRAHDKLTQFLEQEASKGV